MFNNLINTIKQAIFRSNANYFKKMSAEGVVVAVLLSCTFIFLIASIVRVVNNARNNYDIFNSEETNLQSLQAQNKELQSEVSYVNSDEYKQLFLKDTQGLATGNEELFTRRESATPIVPEKEYLSLNDKQDYSDWWAGLLKW